MTAARWLLCGVVALSLLGCGEVVVAEPALVEPPMLTGRLVYDTDDCAADDLDVVPMLENLRGWDDCVCARQESAMGSSSCALEGGPQLSTTGRAWWCAAEAGRCRRLEGNVACSVGESKQLWSQGFEDSRSCGCRGSGGVCDIVVSGEFSVGVVVTTCCSK